jgi:hypothetical protein
MSARAGDFWNVRRGARVLGSGQCDSHLFDQFHATPTLELKITLIPHTRSPPDIPDQIGWRRLAGMPSGSRLNERDRWRINILRPAGEQPKHEPDKSLLTRQPLPGCSRAGRRQNILDFKNLTLTDCDTTTDRASSDQRGRSSLATALGPAAGTRSARGPGKPGPCLSRTNSCDRLNRSPIAPRPARALRERLPPAPS